METGRATGASTTQVTATFRSREAAEQAAASLASEFPDLPPPEIGETTDARFIVRFLLIVVVASIVGTALGVAIGLGFIAMGLTPDTTESLVLQVVTWAIFWHLIIGMIAGYILLADRSEAEWRPGLLATLTVVCEDTGAAAPVEGLLKELGAREVNSSRWTARQSGD
jgi:hypothetical protein